jgi:hypothetical protein
MTGKRVPLWDAGRQAAYREATKRRTRDAAARRDGADTAAGLDAIWAALGAEERRFMDYLLLSGRRTLIARVEDSLFTGLMAKGLLRVPPGVGTLLMQNLRTTYVVPPAVWRALKDRPGGKASDGGPGEARRLRKLAARFADRVEALVEDPADGE